MFLGVQVRFEADLSSLIREANFLGCNIIQFFLYNPRRWQKGIEIELAKIKNFRKERERAKILFLFVHIPYLINLASPHDSLYYRSIRAFIENIKGAEKLGAEYVVTHMGSHREAGEEFGLKRFADALDIILDKTFDSKVDILLENTAGSGSWLGYNFIHHNFIFKRVSHNKRLGICLDTCHAYVSGYDISKKEGIDKMLKEIDNQVGLERLKLIHLNDAKDACGSHRDRHADIGKGKVGIEGMQAIINHHSLKDLPFILETPKKTDRDDIRNLNTVRKLRDEA